MDETQIQPYPKLGFGLMRLLRRGLGIDIRQMEQMADLFLAAGFRYFDTAYVYPGSEEAARKALVQRHDRQKFELATKLNTWMLVRQAGFSFHGKPDLLEEILCDHPQVDFVQLQINYADWENPRIVSRANYEVARAHHVPIIIMEPVKGGALAKPPRQVRELFDAVNPRASYASWALRFAASLPGVLTVLSGMPNVQQVQDNLSFMQHMRPLDQQERDATAKAAAAQTAAARSEARFSP